ncbi:MULTISPECIES: hypothetical protein [Actinomadura]|uniref:Uncharacterized protein n=1 Tax=Actinomadura yumaensis TaxID=111807 RepID=A0ABW2CHE0_9ACTN|nr:hypothetical protein [Actinomadura sp. J1-007]MWK33039.1 hypothetical protein [Actinomadura sp. J1-007]
MTTRTLSAFCPVPVVLSVDLPAGDIEVITTWSRTVAEVTVTGVQDSGDGLDNLGERVGVDGVEVTGATVAGGRITVTAHVPEGSSVAALTRSAPLSAAGVFAEVDFTSVSGDVTVPVPGACAPRPPRVMCASARWTARR